MGHLYLLTLLGICPHLFSTAPHLLPMLPHLHLFPTLPHLHLLSKLHLLLHLLPQLLRLTEVENPLDPTPNSISEKSDSTPSVKSTLIALIILLFVDQLSLIIYLK